jgi:hypothetical protein
MRKEGYYGDGRIYSAISAIFNVRIRVIMPGGIQFEEGDATAPVIEIGYVGHIHYISIHRE